MLIWMTNQRNDKEMRPQLTSVVALEKYKLQVQFEDGTSGVLDVSRLAGKGVFAAWDTNNLFSQPYISEVGAIAWNDDLDIDSLNAYLTIKELSFEEWKNSQLVYASN